MSCKLLPISIRNTVRKGNANVRWFKATGNFVWYTNGLCGVWSGGTIGVQGDFFAFKSPKCMVIG